MTKQEEFVKALQREAQMQKKLYSTHFFPSQLDSITSFIGRYSWQVLLTSSGLTAVAIELWKLRGH